MSPSAENRNGTEAGAGGDVQCEGVVVAVSTEQVSVSMDANPACAACRDKSHCSLAGDGQQILTVSATGFAVGDKVRVITDSRQMLRVSLALYLVPTILILLGSFAGYEAGLAIQALEPDLGAFLGVVAGILLSLAFVHFFRNLTGTNELLLKLEKFEDQDG